MMCIFSVVSDTRKALKKMDAAAHDEVNVPYVVAQLASLLQEDPDPDFDSVRNTFLLLFTTYF
jgi:hypothetical protein